MINPGYFSKKKKSKNVIQYSLEHCTNFLITNTNIDRYQLKNLISVCNAVIYHVMFPDKVIGMKRTRKEVGKKDSLKKNCVKWNRYHTSSKFLILLLYLPLQRLLCSSKGPLHDTGYLKYQSISYVFFLTHRLIKETLIYSTSRFNHSSTGNMILG